MRALNDRMNIRENRGLSKVYGNWAGSVNGKNFLVCLHGKFQPCQPELNTRKKKNKMVEHKLVYFFTIVVLTGTLPILLMKLIRILLSWEYRQLRQKLYHFGRYDAKEKLFWQKHFVSVIRLGCSYANIFVPLTEISGLASSQYRSPINRVGSVSEISPRNSLSFWLKFRCIYMRSRAGSLS